MAHRPASVSALDPSHVGLDPTEASVSSYVLEFEDDLDDDLVVLALHLAGGRLGAASFSADSASLAVLSEVQDLAPDFQLTQSLLSQVRPGRVLVGSRQNSEFLSRVREICGVEEPQALNEDEMDPDGDHGDASTRDQVNTTVQSGATAGLSTLVTRDASLNDVELVYLGNKDFEYHSCHRRVTAIRLQNGQGPSQCEPTDHDRVLRLHNLMDFNSESSIRACGALLKYLDLNQIGGNPDPSLDHCFILSIRPLVIENVLGLDETTFTALQIFNADSRASGSKLGSWNKKREGLSLFQMLNRCKSVMGSKYLRYLCRCPARNLELIRNRQEAIAYFAGPGQGELVKSLQECLVLIKNVPKILKSIASTQAGVKTWKSFKNSLRGALLLIEICGQVRQDGKVLDKISRCQSQNLHAISSFIDRILDMERSEDRDKFTVCAGIDDDLDEMRRQHNGLPDLLREILSLEMTDLPEFMTSCNMIYVPQIGYLLSAEPWREDLQEEDLDIEGLEFMYLANEVPHFKTRRCKELDEIFGDTATKIAEKETAIMVRLVNFILKHSEDLLTVTRYSAVLDCLIALALVGSEHNWKLPKVVPASSAGLQVVNGRHPLQESCTRTFVSNHTLMDVGQKAIILTGPNACGKSVYLKQIGLIAYLAHLGCFVPADGAVVPVMDRIYSRIQTVESVSLGLSSFMVDVNQISLCLRAATADSLVLVDEFGKGTAEIDGEALLSASLEFLVEKNPFLVVTTHFQTLKSTMNDASKFQYFTFDYKLDPEGRLVHLYKLKPGLCSSSFANFVAQDAGIDGRIVQRAQELLQCITKGLAIRHCPGVYDFELFESLGEEFLNLDLDEAEQVRGYFDKLNSMSL